MKYRKSIKPEEFFKQISLNSGVSDLQTVKDIFYGLIKTMSREIRNKQIVELPDWGKFRLTIRKSRRSNNVQMMKVVILPPLPEVRFYPNKNVKEYFRALMNNNGL